MKIIEDNAEFILAIIAIFILVCLAICVYTLAAVLYYIALSVLFIIGCFCAVQLYGMILRIDAEYDRQWAETQKILRESEVDFIPRYHQALVRKNDEIRLIPAYSGRGSVPEISEPQHIPQGVPGAIVACFARFNSDVEITASIEGPQVVRYIGVTSGKTTFKQIENKKSDLQMALGVKQIPYITTEGGRLSIDVPKDKTDFVRLSDITPGKGLEIPIGKSISGEIIYADFTDPNQCHALIAGQSGGGKSEALRSMVAALWSKGRNVTKFCIVDPKLVTFGDLPGVITEQDEVIPVLEKIVEDMNSRESLLLHNSCKNLKQMFEKGITGTPFFFVVMDEFADLEYDNKEKKQFEKLIGKIARKGRSAGIHLILATQRPDKDTIKGAVKTNLPLRICLLVPDNVNSRVVLGAGGAENLVGKGDALVDLGRGAVRVQIPYITDEEFAALNIRSESFEIDTAVYDLKKMPYKNYLKTPHWKKIRAMRLEIDGYKCTGIGCGATKRLEVHHLTYDHRGYEQDHIDDLVTFCRDCHQAWHDKEKS